MRTAQLVEGGAIVAVVGGDGAGKTTAVDGLTSWLSRSFDVTTVHMGKPPWSLTTVAVRGLLKIGKSLGFYPFMKAPMAVASADDLTAFPGYAWLLREFCTARDRYRTYTRARRFADSGGIVICDRFPLPEIKLMDSLRMDLMADVRDRNPFAGWLVGRAERYYRNMRLPDLLIALRVDPDVAVRRKSEEDPTSVRARAGEIWNLDWSRTPAHVIDANRSQAEVLEDLKALVWSEL